jgi:hypothetical protein
MRQNKTCLKIFAAAVFFALTLAGCGDLDEGDVWSDVTSMSQVDGTWEGSYSESLSLLEASVPPEYSDMLNYEVDFEITVETIMTFSEVNETVSGESNIIIRVTGPDASAVWLIFTMMVLPMITSELPEDMIITANNSNKSITMTQDLVETDVSDSSLAAMGLKINQGGDKLKIPAEAFEGYLSEDVILYKR